MKRFLVVFERRNNIVVECENVAEAVRCVHSGCSDRGRKSRDFCEIVDVQEVDASIVFAEKTVVLSKR